MRYEPIDPQLFITNRARLRSLLPPNSLVVLNANDVIPTNADGTLVPICASDLFYLTGVEQEQTILVMYPDADEAKHREILFVREPTAENQLWEGHKLTKQEARKISGIANIQWLPEFPRLFHRLMCECEHVYLNTNEHKRAVIEVETREARFVADTLRRYPLHDYRRLAPLMHRLRSIKSDIEIALLQKACDVTGAGFRRVLGFVQPGVLECEVEAELAHEFIRHGCRFAYPPIIGSGANACCLHYVSNSNVCRDREVLLLDVAAAYANYNADLTRTIPVNGRFTRRQRRVYDAVLRVLRQCIAGLTPGKRIRDWQKDAEQLIEKELVDLGLLTMNEIRRQDPEQPAFRKYFMHGVGHPLGLDVHDVGITTEPLQAGWVMTVEPGIYIAEEGLGVRLENDVLITADGPVDLMADIPIEAEEIEELMNTRKRAKPLMSAAQSRNGIDGHRRKAGRKPANRLVKS
ncbi:MAG TPA: M24 family metallopeptidase [Verrucomicrobia bacterium]|nr:M24 family metallopeptidase [Verrucomicrobiota bacterium]HOP95990.1 Xaa-Pro aminopeptidase [Verrucomicrobiota bacterium]HPU55571.1 Xaa-Pro aminopeptidase [Verrucomicrobiota bacterium]